MDSPDREIHFSIDNEIQFRILKNLDELKRQSPLYEWYFPITVGDNIRIDLDRLTYNIKYLEEKRFIETDGRGGGKITALGIDYLRTLGNIEMPS